ncbi:hypothetical protein Vretimale_6509 [Volvox reticuliferus]|uniref:Uncharacterized protein n=1 Tax=Volvox reticuliferus TaxID=1737510 RepID=A0A8J4G800_9CHLO|nr:hypothetical protein Vretifemale_7351 [Volvox reticuliferus]GIM01803.1 hypothetical protein Vretimale_6509 [Volvox reticuliferus]
MRCIRSPGLGLRSIQLQQQTLALVAAPVQRRARTPAHNLPHAAMPPRCSPPLPLSCALTQGQVPSGWKFPNGGNRQLTRLRRQVEQPLRHPRSCVAGAAAAGSGACATGTCSTGAVAVAATAPAASASPLMELFAVVLGYACLAGSFFRSVPQIAVILRTGSAEGLSLTSNLMELLCFTVTVAYNIQQGYSFNTYGEVFSCWIQDAIIVGLIFRHMRLSWSVIAASTAAFAAICAWLFSPMCPMDVLSALQMSNIVVMAVGARLPQIWLNVKRGNAGVLSPLTCLLNVAGCVVRAFTTAVLTRDGIIMGGCISQLVLNAVLLYQSIATPGQLPTGSTATAAAAATAVAATDPPSGGTGSTGGQLGSGSQGPAARTAANGNNAAGGNGGHAAAAAAAALSPGQKGSKLGAAGATGGSGGNIGGGDGGCGSGSGGGDDGGVTPLPLPAAA